MSIQVIKLGGSSQTKIGYDNLISKISDLDKGIIVVSAIKDITNKLINSKDYQEIKNIHINFIKELKLNENDFLEDFNKINNLMEKSSLENKIELISMGETLTAKILTKYLQKNYKVDYLEATQIIYSNEENSELYHKSCFEVDTKPIYEKLVDNKFIVIPGFRARDKNYKVCLLGRGGSDTSGSIIAKSVNAKCYQIWTDVSGIYTADPNKVDKANIIKNINYDLAQELSAMGAKVIHPYCIKPCQSKNIPIHIKNTFTPNDNTTIINNIDENNKNLKAITFQKNVSVFKIISLNMWNNYGFLFDIFQKFNDYNIDVNIINTSQFDVSVTTHDQDVDKLLKLKKSLEEKYQVFLNLNTVCISLVGNNVKEYKDFDKVVNFIKKKTHHIFLTSYSSNDMSLSFVMEEEHSLDLYKKLHQIIFPEYEFDKLNYWWNHLLDIPGPSKCVYLYNLNTIDQQIQKLDILTQIDEKYYAMKANTNIKIINNIISKNFGIETVSTEEIIYLQKSLGNKFNKTKILYTPNFAHISDYEFVSQFKNIQIIIDNIQIILDNPNVFNKSIGLRLDLNYGLGHCDKVITQGETSKFGINPNDILNNIKFFEKNNIVINGIHSHMGSGISDYYHWIENMKRLNDFYQKFNSNSNQIKWFNLGGGFGIEKDIDFNKLNELLKTYRPNNIKLMIEPGRFIVADSGIIWGKVTQIKNKNNTKFIGVNIGMNNLIRPALYQAIHPVYFPVNSNQKEIVNVVGPICESGDVIIKNLKIHKNIKVDDSIVITQTGAYGQVMSSQYNLKNHAEECFI